ncbi:DNA-binding protein [Castellaniella sp. UC4442_H9]
MDREPLFETAHNALLFAFNFSDQQYERPLMNRLADDPDGHVSMGLSGTDGAAQAGMIMSRIMLMPALSQYIIFAQYAPHALRCECKRPCCSGHRPNAQWDAAIAEVSRSSIAGAMTGTLSHRVLRDAIIRKMFGAKVDIVEAAERCGLEERQAYRHQTAIKQWLDGKRVQKGQDKRGVRAVAFEHITRILTDSGIVKSPAALTA